MRISGVPVGRVKTKELDDESDTTSVEIELDDRYAPIPADTQRGPAPEDAARRDLRRADAGHERRPDGGRRRRRSRAGPGVADGRARRDLPRLRRRRRARRSAIWLDQQGRAFEGRGRGHQRRARQPRAVRRGHERDARDPRPPRARDAAARARHGRGLRRAHRAPGPAPAADRQLEPPLRGHRRARRGAGRDVPHLPDLPRGVARHHRPPDRVRERHRPAGHPAAAGRARAVAHADLAAPAWRPT